VRIDFHVRKRPDLDLDHRYNATMKIDDETCYRALVARDPRFDGLFFVGVTSTGIYCRPICTARTVGRARCRFFSNSALAERQGFRPCLRCRPELAPGHAPVDAVSRTARAAARRIEAGALNNGGSLERLASELGLGTRQLRRVVQREFGVSPIELAQTQRLLLAKQLLTESSLPITQVAFASGFDSVRRFNALFRSHYRLTPSLMRRASPASETHECLRLTLGYRPPLAWTQMVRFLAGRSTAGVEQVAGESYARTVAVGRHQGWLRVKPTLGRHTLSVELATSLMPCLPELLLRLKNLFDLSARPDVIGAHLSVDSRLGALVARCPGVRVPGAFDGFELAVRAVLGQRISVAAATTLAGRLATRFGQSIESPLPGLNRLSPTPERLASVELAELTALGIAAPRAACIRAIARAVADRALNLEPGSDSDAVMSQLQALSGIGDWTAQYIAMRALRWPDAFPAGDLGLLRAFGETSVRQLRDTSEAWRPWRAYAAFYLWANHHILNQENHDD
jgi:AraC family transcriptional regulator of adaptative response / DNA-3-methyladenine glycosylase II